MKKLLYPFTLLTIAAYLAACSGGSTETVEETDETAEAEATEEVSDEVAESFTILAINHEVNDWATWKAAYDEHKQMRDEAGLEELDVLVNIDNPNDVMVVSRSKDHESAAGFADSEDLKTVMDNAGVAGPPNITYWDIQSSIGEDTEITSRYRLLITHEIEDYEKWRPLFDEDETNRAAAGMITLGVAKDKDNANMISIMFAFDDLDKAREFTASEELKTKMQEGGVVGEPTFKWMEVPQATE